MSFDYESANDKIDTSKYEQVYLVGDIHGDPLVLLELVMASECLEMTSTEGSLDSIIEEQRCFSGATSLPNDDVVRLTLKMHRVLDSLSWKENSSTLLIFLGDVVDNRRCHNGLNCNSVPTESEQHIVNTLVRLSNESSKRKSGIVWILGNHDIDNALSDDRMKDYHNSNIKGNELSFRSEWMQDAIRKMGSSAKIICSVDKTSILCHAGVSAEWVGEWKKNFSRDYVEICEVNKYYIDIVLGKETKSSKQRYLGIEKKNSPFRHRPFWLNENRDRVIGALRSLTVEGEILNNACRMIVGHTVQTNPACDVIPDWTEYKDLCTIPLCSSEGNPNDYLLGLDAGMSRAFSTYGSPIYTFCRISEKHLVIRGRNHQRSLSQKIIGFDTYVSETRKPAPSPILIGRIEQLATLPCNTKHIIIDSSLTKYLHHEHLPFLLEELCFEGVEPIARLNPEMFHNNIRSLEFRCPLVCPLPLLPTHIKRIVLPKSYMFPLPTYLITERAVLIFRNP